MEIKDIFLYFAQFPSKDGVIASFTNGSSNYPEYTKLLEQYNSGSKDRLPNIEGFVFGQNFDAVKARIDTMTGNFLFVEVGDIESTQDQKGNINDTIKIACTIAYKENRDADLVEHMIVSDQSLSLINQLRGNLFKDQCPWLRMIDGTTQIQPFVSSELASVGWSFMFNLKGQIFDIKR